MFTNKNVVKLENESLKKTCKNSYSFNFSEFPM